MVELALSSVAQSLAFADILVLADGVWKAQTHHCTKFHQNRSIGCEDIKIFRFLNMAASAILDLFGAYLDHPK